MKLRPADHRDVPVILRLLADAGLPDDDIITWMPMTLVGEQRHVVVACGSLEPLGSCALLRSVAVTPSLRGRGCGRRLLTRLLALAADFGVREVYLLTLDAADFFRGLGFEAVPRESAPEAVRRTRQFTSLCPDSAVLMRRRFAGAIDPGLLP
jgi:N-acetylglutamate synthase-like GNAT family acetyltransferase